MDDSILTRLAIEEIVKEVATTAQAETGPPKEGKINPLRKLNKQFLGRTVNSMLTHNKRFEDRTRRNCRRKLRELDRGRKHRGRKHRRSLHKRGDRRKHKKKTKHEVLSIPSSSSSSSSTSSSSLSSSNDETRRSKSIRKRKRKKYEKRRHVKNENRERESVEPDRLHYTSDEQGEYEDESYWETENVMMPNVALVMNPWMYHQALLTGINGAMSRDTENSNKVTERLPIESAFVVISSSSSQVSSSCSSWEMDKNGIATISILTDEQSSNNERKRKRRRTKRKTKQKTDSSPLSNELGLSEEPSPTLFIFPERHDDEDISNHISVDSSSKESDCDASVTSIITCSSDVSKNSQNKESEVNDPPIELSDD